MLDFESAQRFFVNAVSPLGVEVVPLSAAVGRVLAENVSAKAAVPEFDTSAMDGYALCVDDVQQVPYRLRVEGEAPAGTAPGSLNRGSATRIFTGAPIPSGANAVVMQEHVRLDAGALVSEHSVRIGENVRRKGEELAAGEVALHSRRRITTSSLALLAFLDYGTVKVYRSPRVAILSTGSELRLPGVARRPASIVESNSWTIAALAAQAGAAIVGSQIVADDPSQLVAAIRNALSIVDVLITIGGVSVGEYDFVKPALTAAGVQIELHKVALKPGKPITLGRLERQMVIGLPGNPASAVVTFALFGMPLLRAMQSDLQPVAIPAWVPALEPIKRNGARTRAVLGALRSAGASSGFSAHPNQSSGATVALGDSDGIAIVAPGTAPVECGETVPYHRWTDL
jgi:molybdopterin molybdotransferase